MDHCYSPRPLADYVAKGKTLTYRPTTRPVAWNLIWLSIPSVDRLLEPNLDFMKFSEATDFRLMGTLSALLSDDEAEPIMGPSPVAFVQDLQDHPSQFVQDTMRGFGQSWVDTITARAYQSAGLSEVFEAASKASNVIIADFVARRRA